MRIQIVSSDLLSKTGNIFDVREGLVADLLVLDSETIGSNMRELVRALAAVAVKIKLTATGKRNVILNGESLLTNN